MAPLDSALSLRKQQLQEALDLLIEKHGAQSETVAVIRERLDEVQDELASVTLTRDANHAAGSADVVSMMGGPKVKDAALMFVILGGILIFAFGGVSTMFVIMMAVKW